MSKEFSERLRTERERKGLSQADLAGRSGLQPSAISHFETGNRDPSFDNLRKLADALSVTVDYLLGRTEEPKGASKLVSNLFRDFNAMSADDQESFVQFAAILAAKNSGEKKKGS
jgi:transcriptional regulator with XRE-family HTH domain